MKPTLMKPTLTLVLTTTLMLLAGGAVAEETPPLSPRSEEALLLALDDERHAQALYQAVMQEHGEIRPFSNIIRGEQRHESFLLELMETYGVDVPTDPWAERTIEVPETIREACVQAIAAEKANIKLYDGLLEDIVEADVRDTFNHLRNASAEHHLPAFERCSGSASGRGKGRGQGHGGGHGGGGCGGHCGGG